MRNGKGKPSLPWAKNARRRSKNQIKQIAGSIRTFGFTNPVLIDADNTILAGHGRAEAAILIWMDKVPCVRLENMTPEQKRAYVFVDNKLALNAGWDDEILADELKALLDMDQSLSRGDPARRRDYPAATVDQFAPPLSAMMSSAS